jgi:hypothetical protein
VQQVPPFSFQSPPQIPSAVYPLVWTSVLKVISVKDGSSPILVKRTSRLKSNSRACVLQTFAAAVVLVVAATSSTANTNSIKASSRIEILIVIFILLSYF